MVPEFEDPRALLRSVLAGYGRMLQPHQEEYVLRQYASSGSPFFLQLAAEELRHWRSSDAVADDPDPPAGVRVQDLAGSQQDLVRGEYGCKTLLAVSRIWCVSSSTTSNSSTTTTIAL